MTYSLDSSVLITAWRRNYPPDVFPTLWSNLAELIEDGLIVASVEVRTELEKKDDEILAWTKKREHMYLWEGDPRFLQFNGRALTDPREVSTS